MNASQSKLNTICLLIIAISLVVIAYRQMQPVYVETGKGIFVNNRTGKFYVNRNNQMVPIDETVEDWLKREFPEGKNY